MDPVRFRVSCTAQHRISERRQNYVLDVQAWCPPAATCTAHLTPRALTSARALRFPEGRGGPERWSKVPEAPQAPPPAPRPSSLATKSPLSAASVKNKGSRCMQRETAWPSGAGENWLSGSW